MTRLWLLVSLLIAAVNSQRRGNYNDVNDDVEIDEEFFEDELDPAYQPGSTHIKHPLIVDTTLGRVLGKHQSDEVNAFLGIPYAEPPLGKLRFRPSKPKRPWYPSIYHATKLGPECLQSELFAGLDEGARPRDEDCLHLNIWQPNTNSNQSQRELYPVLIWIYGGAFIHGGTSKAEYDGGVLASKGVVVVTFNYRVGALGFLVSTNDGLYGNYGLHDQKMAIQWVQDNIRGFGGDPQRVTLFGESAGAMSIALHLLDQQAMEEEVEDDSIIDNEGLHHYHRSVQDEDNNMHNRRRPQHLQTVHTNRQTVHTNRQTVHRQTSNKQRKKRKHKPLFHAVIMQSNPLGYRYRSLAVANFIGQSYMELLDCEDLRCLQYESADELLHVQDTLMAVPRSMGDFFTWGPVLTDSSYRREIRLRPEIAVSNMTVRQPIEAMKVIPSLRIPVLLGHNAHEGTVFVFTAFQARMPRMLYRMLVLSFFRSAAPKVLQMYAALVEKVASSSAYADYRLVLAEIVGDYLFRCPNRYFASQLTNIGTPVYLYEFALRTRTPGFTCCDGLSCHTAEIPYPFGHLDLIAADYTYNTPPSDDSEYSAERMLLEEMQLEQEREEQEKEVLLWRQMVNNLTHSSGGHTTTTAAQPINKQKDKEQEKQALSVLLNKASSWLSKMKNKIAATANSNQEASKSDDQLPPSPSQPTLQASDSPNDDDKDNVNISLEPPLKMSPSPSSADAKVARLMMEYWTTFARYGDPNGKHSLFGGEYLQETRPYDAAWWPRLLGDLPSLRAVQDMHHSRNSMGLWKYTGGAYDSHDDYEGEEILNLDSFEQDEEEEATFFFSASNDNNNQDQDSYQQQRPSLRRSSNNENEEDLSLYDQQQQQQQQLPRSMPRSNGQQQQRPKRKKQRRSLPSSSDNNPQQSSSQQHQQHQPPEREKQFSIRFGSGSSSPMSSSALDRMEELSDIGFVMQQRLMHQMTFDEDSSVYIIENDCICNAWNQLEYRF